MEGLLVEMVGRRRGKREGSETVLNLWGFSGRHYGGVGSE